MGAHNAHVVFDGTLTTKQLQDKYQAHIADLRVEYGTDPYNGTLATCPDLVVHDKVFDTNDEAREYGLDHAQKWEYAVAVKSRGIRKTRKSFTFGGKQSFHFGSMSPVDEEFVGTMREGRYVPKVADQLNKTEAARALKLFAAVKTAFDALRVVESPLHPMIAALTNVEKELAPTHFAELKRKTMEYRKLAVKHQKAKAAFDEFAKVLSAKYCTEVVEKEKPVWVVSGWAAC